MKRTKIKITAYIKGLVLVSGPHVLLGWMRKPFNLMSNTLSLTKWIAGQERKNILNDFYTFKRDYSKRYKLYEYVSNRFKLKDAPFDFLEFGVARGNSFSWWVSNFPDAGCRFFGFDTFEGLPEAWGTFNKKEMAAEVPSINDTRVEFIKGLFQDSLPGFLTNHDLRGIKPKVIHLDADLFSSTLYTLTSMAPYLNKGDILIFDEFNVPNHEFLAYRLFCESYYIKSKLIAAVNNYLQVAFIIE